MIKNPLRPPHKGRFLVPLLRWEGALVPLPLWEGLGEGEESRNSGVYEYQINPLPLPLPPRGGGKKRIRQKTWAYPPLNPQEEG